MNIILIILPIIFLTLTGWLFAHFKKMDASTSKALVDFAFNAAIPATVLLSLTSMHSHLQGTFRFALAYAIDLVVVFVIATLIGKVCFNRQANQSGMLGLCASFSNGMMVGLPILIAYYGPKGAIPLAVAVIVFFLFLLPAFIFYTELTTLKGKGKKLSSLMIGSVKQTLTTPIVIATIIGIIVAATHFHWPNIVIHYLKYLSVTIVACALVSIGIDLRSAQFKGNFAIVVVMSLIKNLLSPLIAIALIKIFHLPLFYAVSLVIVMAAPSGKSVYVLAKKYQLCEDEVTGIVSLSTLISPITIVFFMWWILG